MKSSSVYAHSISPILFFRSQGPDHALPKTGRNGAGSAGKAGQPRSQGAARNRLWAASTWFSAPIFLIASRRLNYRSPQGCLQGAFLFLVRSISRPGSGSLDRRQAQK